ncbi:MAG: glycosyltransferase family 2 protein, partial [Archangium sp.]|nr:glycosyltransferase family 2 protein [Archangium sp.]
ALETTLASLLNQPQRPLEILVASPLRAEVLDEVLGSAKRRAGVVAVGVASSSSDWAARTNAGLGAAQGQYLACLEAGDTVTVDHFPALVQRLAGGPEAWALSAMVPALPTRFSPSAWIHQGASCRQAVLIDRQRTATLPLTFAEGTRGAEAMRFARLAAMFPPAWSPSAPSVSRAQPLADEADALLAATLGRPLRMLTSLAEVLRAPEPPSLRKLAAERATTWLETIRRRGREGQ